MDRCVALIGIEPYDKFLKLNVQQKDYYITKFDIFESKRAMMKGKETGYDEIAKNIQGSYLDSRVAKCSYYLYGKQYSLKNFDYPSEQIADSPKRQIEQLYTQAYLMIKKAGLLVYINYANYPKILVREFADQSGLTDYIKTKEQTVGKTLDHEQLAIAFFGSREKWIKGLTNFINQKIGNY